MMLIAKSWDAMTDEEMLIEMDDFGDSHTTIHEAAKRIRAKNALIAALEAERDVVRAEAHDKALQWASLELLNKGFVKELCDAVDALRTAQPEPESNTEETHVV